MANHYSPSQPNQINQDKLFMYVCDIVCDFNVCEKKGLCVSFGKPLLVWCYKSVYSDLVKLYVSTDRTSLGISRLW